MGETFAERWKKKQKVLGFEDRPAEMVRYDQWMLPHEAAPCMTFDRAANPLRVCELWKNSDWSAEDQARLASFLVIGSDGAGNPLCVERVSGEIWLFDHEDRFRTRQFVNSSIPQLGECLLAYMGEKDPDRFRSAVNKIDNRAMVSGALWWHEAATLAE